jgi:hypothetical protein
MDGWMDGCVCMYLSLNGIALSLARSLVLTQVGACGPTIVGTVGLVRGLVREKKEKKRTREEVIDSLDKGGTRLVWAAEDEGCKKEGPGRGVSLSPRRAPSALCCTLLSKVSSSISPLLSPAAHDACLPPSFDAFPALSCPFMPLHVP